MWKCAVIAAVAAACSKGGEPKREEPAIAIASPQAPVVDSPDVLAADEGRPPPVIVLIDEAGKLQVAAAGSWAELATRDLRGGARPVTLEVAAHVIGEELALRKSPKEIVAAIAKAPSTLPPPVAPPVEDSPEDEGPEESGGTGTFVNLDEGVMQRKNDERERERQARIHSAGPRGPRSLTPPFDEEPTRQASVVGEVASDGRFAQEPRTLILAAPRAPATALIRTIAVIDGLIVVAHRGAIRPLRISFTPDEGRARPRGWIEARVSARGLALEVVPDVPHPVGAQGSPLDQEAVRVALEAARASGKLDRLAPIDVLVEPEVDVQRLIDVIVALDLAGARLIGLGEAPAADSVEGARRGKRIPRVVYGPPSVQGDLDRKLIVEQLRTKRAEILACYQAVLATKPELSGTVSTQFFIAPSGKVAASNAAGVDPGVSACVAGIVKTIEFPKPKGGGGAQVNQPFSFRP